MADDKSKRGSPDGKRSNKSEPAAVAGRRQTTKTSAAKTSGSASAKSSARPTRASPSASAKRAPARSAPRPTTARKSPTRAASPARKSASARRRMVLDGTIPPPAERVKRGSGEEKTVVNTALAMKREPDAVDLLTDDHLAVYAIFQKYERLMDADAPADARRSLATTVCRMLTAHTTIEEEIFYPAARKAGIDSDLLDEADIEHQSAKDLIAAIEAGDPDDDRYDARVKVLGEYVAHHVKEEHTEMFPQCRKSGMELVRLRARLLERKAELGADEPVAEGDADAPPPAKEPGLLSKITGGMLGD
jgi:hypothetical protein